MMPEQIDAKITLKEGEFLSAPYSIFGVHLVQFYYHWPQVFSTLNQEYKAIKESEPTKKVKLECKGSNLSKILVKKTRGSIYFRCSRQADKDKKRLGTVKLKLINPQPILSIFPLLHTKYAIKSIF